MDVEFDFPFFLICLYIEKPTYPMHEKVIVLIRLDLECDVQPQDCPNAACTFFLTQFFLYTCKCYACSCFSCP